MILQLINVEFVPGRTKGNLVFRSLINENLRAQPRYLHSFAQDGDVVDDFVGFQSEICRNDQFGRTVGHPAGEFLGSEATEHDGVYRANPRTGQSSKNSLWNHGQINDDPVSFDDAVFNEEVGHLADILVEFPEGVGTLFVDHI